MSQPGRRARKTAPSGAAGTPPPATAQRPAVGGRVVQENPAREQAPQRAPEPDVQFGTRLAGAYPTVEVEVAVNHDRLRRGDRGHVPLTPRIQRRIDNGYLRLLTPVPPPRE